MIQYYQDLEEQLLQIQQNSLSGGQIQKIYSTAFFISLSIRTPGKTWHLYLGRGSGMEGFWLHDAPPPAELRRRDNFLEYLRRYLSSCSFESGELDPSDRIFRLNYQKWGSLQSILFFWRARKLYFLHYYKEAPDTPYKLLLSWRGKASVAGDDLMDLYSYFDEVGRRSDLKHDFKSRETVGMQELLAAEMLASSLKTEHNPTFLQRKKANIQEDLRKTQQWERLQSLLDKQAPLEGIYELKVGDHKIKFEGDLNPYERRNLLFQKIKKLKRGETILSDRLKSVEDALTEKTSKPSVTSTLPIVKPVWGKEEISAEESARVSSPEAQDYRLYQFDGFTVGVGLSARGNDQLRSKWAKKDDVWIHLDGIKSAHAIIKTPSAMPTPDPSALNLAASIVAQISHFSDDWIPIIYTQVKNVKGVTGAPGMVIYKKEKHLRCPRVVVEDVKE